MVAELWATREGLKLAMKTQIHSIHIETDSQIAFNIIRRNEVENQWHLPLLKDIRALLYDMDQIWLGFAYGEANRVADKMANFGKINSFLYQSYNAPSLY